MTETLKVRITAKEFVCRRFALMFMGVKLCVGFGRDSGAKVGYNSRLIHGDIGTGGSYKNWHVYADEGTIFELEVDKEFYNKNKNRIKKWEIEEIEHFSVTKERADALLQMEENLE